MEALRSRDWMFVFDSEGDRTASRCIKNGKFTSSGYAYSGSSVLARELRISPATDASRGEDMTDHPCKGMTKAQRDAFEMIAVNQHPRATHKTLLALRAKGLV